MDQKVEDALLEVEDPQTYVYKFKFPITTRSRDLYRENPIFFSQGAWWWARPVTRPPTGPVGGAWSPGWQRRACPGYRA